RPHPVLVRHPDRHHPPGRLRPGCRPGRRASPRGSGRHRRRLPRWLLPGCRGQDLECALGWRPGGPLRRRWQGRVQRAAAGAAAFLLRDRRRGAGHALHHHLARGPGRARTGRGADVRRLVCIAARAPAGRAGKQGGAARLIAIDWGGSNLRAYRLDEAGRVLERRRGDIGALACSGRHGETLAGVIAGWKDPLVVLSGMIGARGGWVEAPYVPCPASTDVLAAGMVDMAGQAGAVPALAGRSLWCVPGMADHRGQSADVMRGEETQVTGLLEQLGPGSHTVCLPGTHSKWVQVEGGAITRITTALTGELYGLLRRHSILARSMPETEPAILDARAFDAGLAAARAGGGLLHDLFGVRTAALFDRFPAEALPSYLSGL